MSESSENADWKVDLVDDLDSTQEAPALSAEGSDDDLEAPLVSAVGEEDAMDAPLVSAVDSEREAPNLSAVAEE